MMDASREKLNPQEKKGLGEYFGRAVEILAALGLTAVGAAALAIPVVGWVIGGGSIAWGSAIGFNALKARR